MRRILFHVIFHFLFVLFTHAHIPPSTHTHPYWATHCLPCLHNIHVRWHVYPVPTYDIFWQYPVITEKTFFNQNKNNEQFYGFPWATVHDKKYSFNIILFAGCYSLCYLGYFRDVFLAPVLVLLLAICFIFPSSLPIIY